jgi:hypothetical protein
VNTLTPSQKSGFLHQFRAVPQVQVSAGRSDRSKSRRVDADTDDENASLLPCELEGWSLRSTAVDVPGTPSPDVFEKLLISSVRVLDSVKLITTRRGQKISQRGVPALYENLPLSTEPLKLKALNPSGVSSTLLPT